MRSPQVRNGNRLLFAILLVGWLALLPAACGAARAGEFNQVLSIGDTAPQWEDLPGIDDRMHSTAEWADSEILVVVFTCCSCPYAVDAEERLVALDAWLKERGGKLVAINVNKVKADLMPKMKERAEERGFEFPFLFDESQQIAKKYGATTTPEFFVLDKSRRVTYMGSLDDSPDGKKVTTRYVEAAVESLRQGSVPEKTETVPIGCRIRFERERKGR